MIVNTKNIKGKSLFTEKIVKIESQVLETPAKSLQVGKIRESEIVSPHARGFAEVYIKVDDTALENSRTGWDNLRENLKRQVKRANDEEIVVPFLQYSDEELSLDNAVEIAKLESNYGDIVPVPLMTPLVNSADDHDVLSSTSVLDILENTRRFLKAVDKLSIEKPVMGVIPPISEECTRALLDLYYEYDLSAYCVDFNRRAPMARFQLDSVITPLMKKLEAYGRRENSLLYAINANKTRQGSDSQKTPTALYTYALGFDVMGDQHLPPRLPPEVFENFETTNELRLFNPETLSVDKVPPDELESFLPAEGEMPVNKVQRRIANNPDEKFRFEKLINAELISLYLGTDGLNAAEIVATLQRTATEATVETTLHGTSTFSTELLFEVPALIVESVLSTGKARVWFTELEESHQRSIVNLMLGSIGFYMTGDIAVVALSPLIAPSVHQMILDEKQ